MAFIWIGRFMEAAKRAKRRKILAKRAFSPDPKNISSLIQTPRPQARIHKVTRQSTLPEFSPWQTWREA
jgi:hypothetical protein